MQSTTCHVIFVFLEQFFVLRGSHVDITPDLYNEILLLPITFMFIIMPSSHYQNNTRCMEEIKPATKSQRTLKGLLDIKPGMWDSFGNILHSENRSLGLKI